MSVRCVIAAGVAIAVSLAAARAQEVPRELIPNWTAPPYWMPTKQRAVETPQNSGLSPNSVEGVPTPALAFTGIAPCRVVDTRPSQGFSGAYGPPIMAANAIRTFDINSAPHCPGVPAAAEAYSLNFAVTETTGAPGDIRVFPTGAGVSTTSVLNWDFVGPQAIANAIVMPAGAGGSIDILVAGFNTHLIIDINGYYSPQTVVNTLNALSGAVTLVAGSNVTIMPSGQTLTIATDATSSNTPNTIVRRDGAGGFGAGTVALSGNLALPFTSGSAGILTQNGSRLLHTFGDDNVFLGRDAGNLTMTGIDNTASGSLALSVNTSGIHNTATGFATLRNNTTGGRNTANGSQALFANTMGSDNTAYGSAALQINSTGNFNTALGTQALFINSSGSDNTAVGGGALAVTTGNNNIAVGRFAGGNLTTGDNNIAIGHFGVAGETATIRIGSASQERAFLAGVRGVTTGAADVLTVLIDTNGQLGTTASSASVKREISDVGEASSPLLKLRPVSFFYRNDTEGIRQYGLIAEEVAQVMPELVHFSPAGRAETVRYHLLAPLLLNELQKEQRRNGDQESRIGKLLARLDALEARVAECEAPTK